eukprot:CAMPEP_0114597988 /NCGR_PEP_ID=MMETSP0125-20121206/20340_1 /TAXON_ID=485358 ORGANISM="Aristerostoma sp., Strain ATCC 50986" /NCGR_SAMPLE_ID=MMETSP0125 /ASSEMBLY_ACC=CAM_ASM_000245 /LENGTH=112 /DNA_ID=CAMNT_0001803233 /DNA_START=331 /DNA_END=669 /DNA_ORIENTATION=+
MKIVDFAYREMTHSKFQNLKAEQNVYSVLKGNYVVKAIWTFNYQNYICFVLEYMIGGDLSHVLSEVGCFEDWVAKFYFAELLLALDLNRSTTSTSSTEISSLTMSLSTILAI